MNTFKEWYKRCEFQDKVDKVNEYLKNGTRGVSSKIRLTRYMITFKEWYKRCEFQDKIDKVNEYLKNGTRGMSFMFIDNGNIKAS